MLQIKLENALNNSSLSSMLHFILMMFIMMGKNQSFLTYNNSNNNKCDVIFVLFKYDNSSDYTQLFPLSFGNEDLSIPNKSSNHVIIVHWYNVW